MFKIVLIAAAFALAVAEHIERDAQIVNYQSDIHPDGSYNYAYETTNGIAAQEQGAGGVGATGSAQYVAPDGNVVKLTYSADANGFVAQGSHVPQIPEAILRSLEWNRNHPEEDDYLHPELSGVNVQQVAQQYVNVRPQGLPVYQQQQQLSQSAHF